ncbi:MAG: SDR family oxidoreductase [Alphaproteobacteria bacterium]
MPRTPDYFADKAIVITGAGSGIGRATALIFGREGANVLCADIDGAAAQETADQVIAAGAKAAATTTDVCDRAAVEAMAAAAIESFGALDFLFNSAGSAIKRAKFLDIDDDLWKRAYDLNVNGVFYGMQAALPHMIDAGRGVIVNMASMSHKRGGAGASIHYASAKGAVLTMTLGVAREFVDRGIRCLAISPGPVDTAFQAAASTSPELMQQFRNDVPMKRFGHPEEIGELVLFMCSDACEFMTADTVYVNGGGGWR